jgi:hypothetical protein
MRTPLRTGIATDTYKGFDSGIVSMVLDLDLGDFVSHRDLSTFFGSFDFFMLFVCLETLFLM